MAPFILIRDARLHSNIYPIPTSLPAERAALAEPLSVALHGVNLAAVGPGSKVVVLGAGPIGLCSVIAARHKGAREIVSVDLSDTRLERARRLGASSVVNTRSAGLGEALGAVLGAGERYGARFVDADAFIDCAGSPALLQEALDLAKYRAKFAVIALHKKPVPVDMFRLMANEIQITGSIADRRHAEFGECVDLLAAGDIDVEPLISHRIGFDRIEEAFATAADPNASAKVVLTFPEQG